MGRMDSLSLLIQLDLTALLIASEFHCMAVHGTGGGVESGFGGSEILNLEIGLVAVSGLACLVIVF